MVILNQGLWQSIRQFKPRTLPRKFAKDLSKLPSEELERCSELLYNQRARPVPRRQRAAALLEPSLSPVRASVDCLFKVTVCTRPFRTDGPRHNSSALYPEWLRASLVRRHPSRRGDDALAVID